MGLTMQAIKAFKAKGIRVDSRIKDKRKPITLKHAIFSGYALLDDFTDMLQAFICKGCIIQDKAMKGYLMFSYPETDPNLLDQFKWELSETGNHLRFIGYSDRLIINN